MKRLLLSVLAVMLLVCGCSMQNHPKEPLPSESSITLEFWDVRWGDSDPSAYADALGALVEEYCALHPEINIEIRAIAQEDVYDTFLSAAIGNRLPDACSCPMAQPIYFAARDQALDLSPIVAQWAAEGVAYPLLLGDETLDMYTSDGILTALPFGADCRVLYYRSDMFEKAGITKAPVSVGEFSTAFQKLSRIYPETVPFLFSADTKATATAASLFFLSMNGATSETSTLDASISSRNTISSFRILEEWMKDGYVSAQSRGYSEEDVRRSFLSGNACMVLTSPIASWLNGSDLYGVCRVANTPAGTYAIRGYTYYSPVCYQGFADTEHPDEVRAFLKWLYENNERLFTEGKSSILPLREDYAKALGENDGNIASIYEMIRRHGRMSNYPHIGIYPFQYILQQQGILGMPLTDVLSGVDVLEALSKVDNEYRSILESFGY